MSSTHSKHIPNGFTLLELLVVVAIIGFLSSLSVVALSVSQANNRDTQRKLDQVTIIKAAELYTTDFGVPPTQVCCDSDNNGQCDASCTISQSDLFTPVDVKNGMFVKSAYAQFGGGSGCAIQYCPPPCIWKPAPLCQCSWQPGCLVGGPVPTCGNGSLETGEECDDGNTQSGDGCDANCNIEGCDNNGICEPSENLSNCPNDCFVGSGGGGGGCIEQNGQCDAGETPGGCGADCTDSSMCYVNGEWDLCCLFNGSYCVGYQGVSTGGYYGVCNGNKCEVRYFLQKPPVTCTVDTEQQVCAPGAQQGAGTAEQKFVASAYNNWLRGLEPYIVKLPKPPCTNCIKDPDPDKMVKYNKYWCSSNTEIVGKHRFCCWIAMENQRNNVNPYTIFQTPTGPNDTRWSVLCMQ